MKEQIREWHIDIGMSVFMALVIFAGTVWYGWFVLGPSSPVLMMNPDWSTPGIGWLCFVPIVVGVLFIAGIFLHIATVRHDIYKLRRRATLLTKEY